VKPPRPDIAPLFLEFHSFTLLPDPFVLRQFYIVSVALVGNNSAIILIENGPDGGAANTNGHGSKAAVIPILLSSNPHDTLDP
jgi:hypothetical protein